MPQFPELYVLRHGETEWNRELRSQGTLDSPLTQQGQDHARAQGVILDRLNIRHLPCFGSPQGRAVHTAQLAGLDPVLDPRLAEVNMGDGQGMLRSDIAAKWPDCGPTDENPFGWDFCVPNAETTDHMVARVTAFLSELTEPSIIVTHGITSRFLRGVYLGLDLAGMRALTIEQGRIYHLKDGEHTVV